MASSILMQTSCREFSLPAIVDKNGLIWLTFIIPLFFFGFSFVNWAIPSGGPAWRFGRNRMGHVAIHGPRGLPIFGSLFSLSHGLPHHTLACMASSLSVVNANAKQLMAFSLGSTHVVVTSDPQIAKEILTSSHFGDRPIKQSARELMFDRAMGFAPSGAYWRLLRRLASLHLFAPKRILAHETRCHVDCNAMLSGIQKEQAQRGTVCLRKHLQAAALNNIMGLVFGRRYENGEVDEPRELNELVREGFEILGAFNWCDHLPWLRYFYDHRGIHGRCKALVPRVQKLVGKIVDEHQNKMMSRSETSDCFLDVLLSLGGEDKLQKDDMVAVLWEMIFRGVDTIALSTEWIMAELVLNPNIQLKLQTEIDKVLGKGDNKAITNSHLSKLPYLHAIIKEGLRLHLPGPLLSWARLSTSDVHLSNGMVVPAHTTAMVNMWAITHDPNIWDEPMAFKPERFLDIDHHVDISWGSDLRLAPFGAGRRVCPGRNLGLATVTLWVAKLVQYFKWIEDKDHNPVDLEEVLKLSSEMKKPLCALAIPRN
ncbi:hypothetical protein Ancab_038627 [Ancistrocladus abbreviatus]